MRELPAESAMGRPPAIEETVSSLSAVFDTGFPPVSGGVERCQSFFGDDPGRSCAQAAAVLDPDQDVAVFQRAQPVGDDEGGAAAHQPFHRLHNAGSGPRIDGTGRFAEDQNGRILQEHARPRYTRTFAFPKNPCDTPTK